MKDWFIGFMLFTLVVDFGLRVYSSRGHVIQTGDLVALSINGGAIVFGLAAILV